jgi:hypothetical protein
MFVEESKAPASEQPKAESPSEPAKTDAPADDESKVKFHKKYD